MSHILVRWTTELSWDVYPVRSLTNAAVGLRLLTEEGAINDLRNTVVEVQWKEGEPPAPAYLLDFGTEKAMERRRTKLARSAPQQSSQSSAEESSSMDEPTTKKRKGYATQAVLRGTVNVLFLATCCGGRSSATGLVVDPSMQPAAGSSECTCGALERIGKLEERIKMLESSLEEAQNNYDAEWYKWMSNLFTYEVDTGRGGSVHSVRLLTPRLWLHSQHQVPATWWQDSYRMVKQLRKIVSKMGSASTVEAEKVNIGDGVLVEKAILDRLHTHCRGAAAKFARNLLRSVFTPEELRDKSLFGGGSNAKKDVPVKEALDPVRVNAVIGCVRGKFDTTVVQIKNSLSSMLSREIK